VANLLETAGFDRVITIDLHQGQIQGFFDIPVTHLTALYLLGDYFMAKSFDWDNTVVVSPDMGRAKAAKKLADQLGCSVAIAHKSRPGHNQAEVMGIIGDIKGKTCIINDDMIDTAGTLCGSLNKLKEMGAGDIYVCATHGLFTGPAIERLEAAPIVECVITDSVPCAVANTEGSKIKMVSVARELAEAIHHVYCNEPTTEIFGGDLNL
jgi:ribose-phosphate pyrophosphokinase